MECLTCLIKGCQARVYAPAGTHSICREYILSDLTQPALLMSASAAIADPLLRRAFGQRARPSDPHRTARGPQMFMQYAGMKMEERDPLVAEWANTIRIEEAPTSATPKS